MFSALRYRRWETTRSRRFDLFGSLVAASRRFGWLPGDHAGHLAADQYGGSPKLDNLVSQFSKLNLSEFRRIELQWLKALNREPTPGQVSVDMKIETDPATGRPTKFIVNYTVDGVLRQEVLKQ